MSDPKLRDCLTRLQLSGFDDDAEPEALLTMLVSVLKCGDAGPETQKWLATLLSPDGKSFYRLKVVQRRPGNPVDRRQKNVVFFELYDLWRDVANKRAFVRIAADRTGLHENTIRAYVKEIIEMEAAENENTGN